jgi:NADH-quinone oxidoreductase subunit E
MSSLTKEKVVNIIADYNNDPQQLIAILLDIQAASGINCVEKQWAQTTASVLQVPLSKIYDVLTFYAMFSTQPRGEYVIEICKSTPCYFSKSDEAARWFEEAAGIKMGGTSADGKVTLLYTSCVGACDIGPVAKIGDDVFGNLTPEKAAALVECCRNTGELKKLCQN